MFFLTWAALLVLLALTLGSAYVSMGPWNSIVNMAIAAAKTLLVALYFMHLARASALKRLVAGAALFTLALLFGLSGADYVTRDISPAPWSATRPH
jgi:cytochrome c oxidase subunit 4